MTGKKMTTPRGRFEMDRRVENAALRADLALELIRGDRWDNPAKLVEFDLRLQRAIAGLESAREAVRIRLRHLQREGPHR